MNMVDKVSNWLRLAGDVPVSSITFIVLGAAWLVRTLHKSSAVLWPSAFGDNSPFSFSRAEDPREYWALVLLSGSALAALIWVLLKELSR